jgi:ApaG protein
VTAGIRVRVQPRYLAEQSDPEQHRFMFAYRISIRNESERIVQLLSRHWIIVDADGERHVVRGEGVVGQQPELRPGASFEYASFCPLQTSWGTMEGSYLMQVLGGPGAGELVEVQIARFFLVAEAATSRVPGVVG